jgi:chemotaxis protein methyltransferase CheR
MTGAAEALAARLGLRDDEATRARVARGVRLAAGGDDADRWWARAVQDPGALEALVDAVTVQESSFFRDPAHFEHLAREVLPAGAPGVIWSAGCARGQEAWSLAMTLAEAGALAWRIVATDVSQRALAVAEAGVYPERRLRGLSPERRERFLVRTPDGEWRVGDELRGLVRFVRGNLATDPPPAAADGRVVFCRHVLMYLDDAVGHAVLEGIARRMPPDGWLYLGGGEAMAAAVERFRLVPIEGGLAYRPRAGAADASTTGGRGATPPPRRERPATGHGSRTAADHGGRARVARAVRDGERSAARGDAAGAVSAFRRAARWAPDDPLAHLRLGLALESAGRPTPALLAFRMARAAQERCAPERLAAELEGWSAAEVERLLADRLRGLG